MKAAELPQVAARVKLRFDAIKKAYPALKGWLVYSNRFGQSDLDSVPKKLVAEFPEMFLDSTVRTECLRLVRRLRTLERSKTRQNEKAIDEEIGDVDPLLKSLAGDLDIDPMTHVEIRFHDLDFAGIINPLLADPLIDRSRSQKGGIRIVIATIEDLFRPSYEPHTSPPLSDVSHMV